jgi:DhnA family fructose-bisphosphate aldolase class Ia
MLKAKIRRSQRLFREDGRTLIVAMDHGIFIPVPGLEDPRNTIGQVVHGGADAILTTFGIAQMAARDIGRAGLILRLDGGTSSLGSAQHQRSLIHSIEDALALGADAVACMAFPGIDDESTTLPYVSKLAAETRRWGMPLLVEAMPHGFQSERWTPEGVALATRIAAELGADVVKTTYTGTCESFRSVVSGCFAPIVVMGGARSNRPIDVLHMVHDALEAGAAGIAIGRNIWQHPCPERMTRALAALIHDGASPDAALALLEG